MPSSFDQWERLCEARKLPLHVLFLRTQTEQFRTLFNHPSWHEAESIVETLLSLDSDRIPEELVERARQSDMRGLLTSIELQCKNASFGERMRDMGRIEQCVRCLLDAVDAAMKGNIVQSCDDLRRKVTEKLVAKKPASPNGKNNAKK